MDIVVYVSDVDFFENINDYNIYLFKIFILLELM